MGGASVYGNHVILVSPQSQLDFGFFTSLGLGLGLGLGGQGLGLGFDNNNKVNTIWLAIQSLHSVNKRKTPHTRTCEQNK